MKSVHLVQLYPKEMNIYGDMGNLLVLQKRLEWRDIPVKVSQIGIAERIPGDASLILGGGGQDAGQLAIEADLQAKVADLRAMADAGVPMLMICGMYQLFGHRFVTHQGTDIKGAGIFDAETHASHDRLIGNLVIDSTWGQLVGYENHSGKTYLSDGALALGAVRQGAGNNNEDGLEGCRVQEVYGTYMHGPLLSKNFEFADMLLGRALEHAGLADKLLTPLNDHFAEKAAAIAATRPY